MGGSFSTLILSYAIVLKAIWSLKPQQLPGGRGHLRERECYPNYAGYPPVCRECARDGRRRRDAAAHRGARDRGA